MFKFSDCTKCGRCITFNDFSNRICVPEDINLHVFNVITKKQKK